MRAWTSFDAHADEWGVAVAYPDGYRGGWADGRGVTAADSDGIDDVAFLRALIDWSAERHGTRGDHTIVAGISNGAFMNPPPAPPHPYRRSWAAAPPRTSPP